MPKSRNKKGHKKKSRARTEKLKSAQEAQKKAFQQMLQNAQKEALEKNQPEQESDIVTADDIGDIGDFSIDDEIEKETEKENPSK